MEPLLPGATVDRYRLVTQLGVGGQGSVWRAEDPLHDNAPVALKVISLHLVGPAEIDRFRREARVLAHLSHPSLPRCHAFFEDLHRDVLGFALDLVEGSPLKSLADGAELSGVHRAYILRHLADALRYIHEAGLVHRDLKMENVMIDRSFFSRPEDPASVKLVDFGIAAATLNPTPITAPGGVIGTVEFLAPELVDRGFWKGSVDGPERDVFAFGVLAYELAKGRHPTGLGEASSMGDYLIAYREMADKRDAFPPDIKGDPLEAFYRRCLALRSGERAKDGAAALSLLEKTETMPVRVTVTVTASTQGTSAAELEGARTELVGPDAPAEQRAAASDRKKARAIYAAFLGLGAVGFTASFLVAYYRPTPARALPFPSAFPALPIPLPSGANADGKASYFDDGAPGAAPLSKTLAGAHAASPQEPLNLTCPADMILVSGGSQSFCIDQREVTVTQYRQCLTCGPAKDVFWPGITPVETSEHAKNCTGGRPGMDDKPITCVTWFDANQYCTSRKRRLPRMEELRLSRSGVQSCQNVPQACPLFEWASDALPHKSHPTRGPSWRYRDAFEGSNPEGASNDDLGFRCADDPSPAAKHP